MTAQTPRARPPLPPGIPFGSLPTSRLSSPPPASSGALHPEGQFLFSWAAVALCWLIGYPPYTAEPAPSALWTQGHTACRLPLESEAACAPHRDRGLPPPCRLRHLTALEHHPVLIGRRPAASPPGWWLNSYPPLPEEPLRLRPSDPKARPRPSNANAHTACLPSRSRERLDPACLAASLAPSCLLQPKAQTRDRAPHCPEQEAATVLPPNPRPPPAFLRPHGHALTPPAPRPNFALPLPRPSRCPSPGPTSTWPTWLNSYPPLPR